MGSASLGGTTGHCMTGLVLSLGPKNRIKHTNDIYKLNEIAYTNVSINCRKTVDVIENDFPIQIGFMKNIKVW
jgi:hypothetical protein